MSQDLVVNGLRLGSLVEVYGIDGAAAGGQALAKLNGQLGQIVSYAAKEDKFFIHLVSGLAVYVDPKNVRVPKDLHKPGEYGGESSFDLLMGPMTSSETLGQEISTCLFEKGFCVLKLAQSDESIASSMKTLEGWDQSGRLTRLPEEVEEGYLGKACRGKISWLDFEDPAYLSDEFLSSSDENLTHIARVFEPYSRDTLGESVQDRTPALLSVSLTDENESEYPYPMADDKTLGDFLNTWRRSLVRAVHFLGPVSTQVILEAKGEADVPNLHRSASLLVAPNTILLFRPDVYEYTCEVREETVMMISNFLSAAPNMLLAHVEGDIGVLTAGTEGPPPPTLAEHGGVIDVVNIVARCAGRFDDQWCYKNGLAAGTDGVVKIPLLRWDVDFYYTPSEDVLEPWQCNNKHQGWIDGCEMFDNKYFEISNAESLSMDPVQRLVLEVGGTSLAMNGLTKKKSNTKASHAGCSVGNDKLDWMTIQKDVEISGNSPNVLAMIANRFSFVFNMKGPNFVCDTACSASLVASHLAKLMLYETKWDKLEWHLSLGAHLVLGPGPFIGCCQSHMSTIKGRCFTFNSSADGYLRGEAGAGMMLKFGNDRDTADGILRATQAGQDGRSASLTAPNGPAQEEMITRAIREAQMSPAESTVWECHGTGTSLGDPIEVGAVRKTQIKVPRVDPLLMSSNKSNMGHGEGAAGMCGMVKCVIQVKASKCLPTLHLRTLNPHLEHAKFESHFETEAQGYPYAQGHSQVSSFGFGGTNGHAIFWGLDRSGGQAEKNNPANLFSKKLQKSPVPEIRMAGNTPDDWESDWPDTRGLSKGATWVVRFDKNDPPEAPLKYTLADDGLADLEELDDHFYAITGNFNDWESDRMVAGEVSGLWTTQAEIPDSGFLEFHVHEDGDPEKVFCPASANCSRKMEQIVGPEVEQVNNWVIRGEPGHDVSIEFFVQNGLRSILWVKS